MQEIKYIHYTLFNVPVKISTSPSEIFYKFQFYDAYQPPEKWIYCPSAEIIYMVNKSSWIFLPKWMLDSTKAIRYCL